VVIIGSGPAGLTAAIYTARANLAPLVIEGEPSSTTDQPGGQLMLTTEVENFPGFVDGIQGPELMASFRAQAARFGAEFLTEKVSRVDFEQRPFELWVGDPTAAEPTYTADAVIVSTGARSIMIGLEAEQRLLGYGLSTCATCDGFFFKNRQIAVVGGATPRWRRRSSSPSSPTGRRHPPSRRAPGQQDHAGAGVQERQDRVPVGHRGRRPHR
jgi:thioredoxin reductase (NADPH)